jgi:K+-transporting ATPase ATPase B chain
MASINLRKVKSGSALFDPKIVWPAVGAAFAKLDPRLQIKNPVMFVVEVVAALTTLIFIRDLFTGADHLGFTFQIILWLWIGCYSPFRGSVAKGVRRKQPLSGRPGEAFSPSDHG